MGEGLEAKVNKPGFFKKAALIVGASALFFLVGCAQELIQYRARVQTKPPAEVNIYVNGNLKGRTSKKEPVYVESEPFFKDSKCSILLSRNKYNAHFIMRYLDDIRGAEFEKVAILNPEGKSKNCLEARITKWEKGPSYDFLFEIPRKMLIEVYKREVKLTEWGDEIKEGSKVIPEQKEPYKKPSEPIKPAPKKAIPYTKPEPKKPYEKPAVREPEEPALPIKKPEISTDIGKLVDKKPVEFFASIGIGNTFGGLGAAGGVLFNLGEIPSIEVSLGLGYMSSESNSEFNTLAVEGNAALNFRYLRRFSEWSWYIKGFGGIQGKAIGKTNGHTVEEQLLFGFGLIGGHRWDFSNKYFGLIGIGFRYTLFPKEVNKYPIDAIYELGAGMKF